MEVKYLLFGFALMMIGMGVVFCALFSLQIAVSIVSFIDKRLHRKVEKGDFEEDSAQSDELIAVIAASVEVVLSQRVKIHRIRMISDRELEVWSKLGRLSIMNSHLPKRGK